MCLRSQREVPKPGCISWEVMLGIWTLFLLLHTFLLVAVPGLLYVLLTRLFDEIKYSNNEDIDPDTLKKLALWIPICFTVVHALMSLISYVDFVRDYKHLCKGNYLKLSCSELLCEFIRTSISITTFILTLMCFQIFSNMYSNEESISFEASLRD